MFLILNEPEGLGERDGRNRDSAPVELELDILHLAEVGLARQSGEMAEKDQKQMLLETTAKCDPLTVQIEQRQFIESNFFHATTGLSRFDRRRHAVIKSLRICRCAAGNSNNGKTRGNKKGRSDPAPLSKTRLGS
jgi:hypothetical protein